MKVDNGGGAANSRSISIPINFCERPANVLDQIVQVLSSGAGLVMSKWFLGSPLIRLVYFVTTMYFPPLVSKDYSCHI